MRCLMTWVFVSNELSLSVDSQSNVRLKTSKFGPWQNHPRSQSTHPRIRASISKRSQVVSRTTMRRLSPHPWATQRCRRSLRGDQGLTYHIRRSTRRLAVKSVIFLVRQLQWRQLHPLSDTLLASTAQNYRTRKRSPKSRRWQRPVYLRMQSRIIIERRVCCIEDVPSFCASSTNITRTLTSLSRIKIECRTASEPTWIGSNFQSCPTEQILSTLQTWPRRSMSPSTLVSRRRRTPTWSMTCRGRLQRTTRVDRQTSQQWQSIATMWTSPSSTSRLRCLAARLTCQSYFWVKPCSFSRIIRSSRIIRLSKEMALHTRTVCRCTPTLLCSSVRRIHWAKERPLIPINRMKQNAL